MRGAGVLEQGREALLGVIDAGCGRDRMCLVPSLAQLDSGHGDMRADVLRQLAGQGKETTRGIGLHIGVVEPGSDGGSIREPP